MSYLYPTPSEELPRVTQEVAHYQALLTKHTANNYAKGIKVVSILLTRREREQRRLSSLVGLSVNQANHLYG